MMLNWDLAVRDAYVLEYEAAVKRQAKRAVPLEVIGAISS